MYSYGLSDVYTFWININYPSSFVLLVRLCRSLGSLYTNVVGINATYNHLFVHLFSFLINILFSNCLELQLIIINYWLQFSSNCYELIVSYRWFICVVRISFLLYSSTSSNVVYWDIAVLPLFRFFLLIVFLDSL